MNKYPLLFVIMYLRSLDTHMEKVSKVNKPAIIEKFNVKVVGNKKCVKKYQGDIQGKGKM